MQTKTIRNKLEQKKGRRDQIQSDIETTKKSIRDGERKLQDHEKAREIIRKVGLDTQKQLEYNISEITSLALEAVLTDPYKLMVEFVERRNKNECDLYFDYRGNKIIPKYGGGGSMDIAAFALRVASWSMQSPKTRPVLILDESFRHVKGEKANKRVLDMIKEISDKMNLQIIIVSDERTSRQDIMDSADRLFEIELINGVSNIKKIK